MRDVRSEPRFDATWDAKTAFVTRNLLAVPLHPTGVDGHCLGCLQLINKQPSRLSPIGSFGAQRTAAEAVSWRWSSATWAVGGGYAVACGRRHRGPSPLRTAAGSKDVEVATAIAALVSQWLLAAQLCSWASALDLAFPQRFE